MRVSNLLVAKEEGSSSLHAQMPKRQPPDFVIASPKNPHQKV